MKSRINEWSEDVLHYLEIMYEILNFVFKHTWRPLPWIPIGFCSSVFMWTGASENLGWLFFSYLAGPAVTLVLAMCMSKVFDATPPGNDADHGLVDFWLLSVLSVVAAFVLSIPWFMYFGFPMFYLAILLIHVYAIGTLIIIWSLVMALMFWLGVIYNWTEEFGEDPR